MKTEEIALSRIVENENNPRTITTEKFKKLVKSLLVFPRMLTLRPIVVDETMTVLGGNMRLKALKHIVTMDGDAMRSTIEENDKFSELEVANLVSYWTDWRKKPTATIINAADLTEAQKREFIIKDNVGFGDWDTDMLANLSDEDLFVFDEFTSVVDRNVARISSFAMQKALRKSGGGKENDCSHLSFRC